MRTFLSLLEGPMLDRAQFIKVRNFDSFSYMIGTAIQEPLRWVTQIDTCCNQAYTSHPVVAIALKVSILALGLIPFLITLPIWALGRFIEDKSSYTGHLFKTLLEQGHTFPSHIIVQSWVILKARPLATSLPSHMQITESLTITDCANITSLPEGLRVMGKLDITNLPNLTSLSKGTEVIGNCYIEKCEKLTHLPEDLYVGGDLILNGCTSLTSLPDWITKLGRRSDGMIRNVDLRSTGLPYEVIEKIRMADTPGMNFILPEFATVEEAIFFWRGLSQDLSIGLPYIPESQILIEFMGRLLTTAEYKNQHARTYLAKRMMDLFSKMATDNAFHEQALELMDTALSSCDDAIIDTINKLELILSIKEIEKGGLSSDRLRQEAKRFFMLELVDAKVRELLKARKIDDIELYLAFHICLAERFNLPVKTRNMIFWNMTKMSQQEINSYGDEIEQEFSEEKLEAFLKTWGPWQNHLRQYVPPYEELPTTEEKPLNETCIISQDTPVKPVIYKKNLYDYDSFLCWYRANGKEPMGSGKIDIRELFRPIIYQ